MNTLNLDLSNYRDLLKQYIRTQDETALYQAEQFSKLSMQQNISPEEIINVHIQALQDLYPELPEGIESSMNFLLEAMISYGLAYQEFQSLREQQLALKSEISVAASMQQTLLTTVKPEVEGLEIGAISIPANQMNGDYHHFVQNDDNKLGIAIADVIGKGIPAALAMSMIKYSMDSIPENRMDPSNILESLNRVVERNVDPSMFITMFYGLYDPGDEKFYYSSAGHEPGFYYNAAEDKFEEIEARGVVLGVTRDTKYRQYERKVNPGDMIIMLTDGVTECRQGDRFIEPEEVLDVIKANMHLPAQKLVEQVYKHFERLQDFHLRDDFTLIILRKEV
ncbi:PP2C family protein-serine/threonine phosphatase [Sediminibacillus halophilus]|uniref:Sigma-B regulation protein RsbU (Phosphoserine phosphatase) n=1 Tax=Sediminibacillus halophilus TaxID=482461 RepID=A0A1G9WR03_9BACI|nr:PP2C family protein-serine/threonine phosphatase [Sediminibacillus halophilus]SDM86603.1 sigma-B regulation protein RsbU (phosphoserine phosphatase) [Sediminibacillus halophilus]